jgi:integrase
VRVGELLALGADTLSCERDVCSDWPASTRDGKTLHVHGSEWNGRIVLSSREKNHNRPVPVPRATLALLNGYPVQLHCEWRFPAPGRWRCEGKLWRYRSFLRQVWAPTVERSGMDVTPHDLRHSWETHLRASGIDIADAARVAGHTVATASARYTHSLGKSFDQMRELFG